MWLSEFLEQQIVEKLEGNKDRLLELFLDEAFFDQLVQISEGNHGFYFEPNSFDGEYLVKTECGYTCYEQERGRRGIYTDFPDLHSAAKHFFRASLD